MFGGGAVEETVSREGWAEFLAAFYFDEAHDGEEILFSVDDLALAEISGLDGAKAVESLADAVRLTVGPLWLLHSLARHVARWRLDCVEGPHPALPLLALTVVAASRMGEDATFAPNNYYVPLRH